MTVDTTGLKRVSSAKAIVVVGNRGLWKDDFVPDLHKMYRRHEFLINPVRSLDLIFDSIKLLHRSEQRSAPETTKKLYESLIKHNLGTNVEMYGFAWEYVEQNQTRQVSALRKQLPNLPVYLVTTSGSTVAEAAHSYFRLSGVASNRDIFQNGRLIGIELTINSEEDKMRHAEVMLNARGVSLSECAVIVSKPEDLVLAQAARVTISSPNPSRPVLDATALHL